MEIGRSAAEWNCSTRESVQEVSGTVEKNRNESLSKKGGRIGLILRKGLPKRNLIMYPFICGGRISDTYKNIDSVKPGNNYHLLNHLLSHKESNYWVFKTFLLHAQCLLDVNSIVQQFIYYIYEYPWLKKKR